MVDVPLLPRSSDFVQLTERNIKVPSDSKKGFMKNVVETNKYNFITFLPKNIWEQFHKLANVYFLVIAVLQSIPAISVTGGIPNILLPLSFVLAVSGIKDLLEDNKRKRSDEEENSRITYKRQDGEWVPIKWSAVKVGDILMVYKDEYFSADMVLLASSEPNGICYVETKNLDGETNMKHKLSHKDTNSFMSIESNLDGLSYSLTCEGPNSRIYLFNGVLTYRGSSVPLTNEQFLLRGCSMRNTAWVMGLVAYTGHETKIMLNSGRTKPKYSSIEVEMNSQILLIFMMQVCICATCAFFSNYWYGINLNDTQAYLDLKALKLGLLQQAIYQFCSWMLIFSNFVPISLIVSLEMVKFLQAQFLSSDSEMYYEPYGMTAKVQSSNLNEELGQISYIFSDKTGTLTCNIMEFRKCSIGGYSYGSSERMNAADKIPNVDFNDDSIDRDNSKVADFFTHLATCHTVIAEEEDGKIEYKASSPDELALVYAAKYFGINFLGRDKENNLELDMNGDACVVRILNVIEFNSVRKRMSVIAEMPDGTIKLLVKGADSVLLPRLVPSPLIETTWKHMEEYAEEGLRTLVIAAKDIEPDEYLAWAQRFFEAMNDIHDRDRRVEALADQLEKNLYLIGATAIEDRLQDNVPETIASIREAGIKVWVLTGDKIETAVNIGYSCNLLSNDMVQITIQGIRTQEVKQEIIAAQQTIKVANTAKKFALIVSGEALIKALNPELTQELMTVADKCQAVICCRVSPQQKAEVVQMVRKALPKARTLAIGDGANDVNMITAAHVGIGISGLEGQQAVRSSDFAVAQFAYLQRLLFVHGRESYRKNSALVCYNFYKNILLTMPLFWYGFFSAFSGQLFYNTWTLQLYNLVFAAMPIIIFALFDREIEAEALMKNPKHYEIGLYHQNFNTRVFWSWIGEASFKSFCILVTVMLFLNLESCDSEHGRMMNLATSGIGIFSFVVIFANLEIFLMSYIHFWFNIITMLVSSCLYFVIVVTLTDILPVQNWLNNFENRGSVLLILGSPTFYLTGALLMMVFVLKTPLYREIKYLMTLKRQPAVVPYKIVIEEVSSEEEELLTINSHRPFSISPAYIERKRNFLVRHWFRLQRRFRPRPASDRPSLLLLQHTRVQSSLHASF